MSGKFDSGYSFQSAESLRLREEQRRGGAPGDGQRECSRDPAELCSGFRLVTQPDGTFQRRPGLTYRAFCDPCADHLAACLRELPLAYLRLAHELRQQSRGGRSVRVPFGPRIPLRAEIDALMRYMAPILAGWDARVRATARLSRPDRRIDTPGAVTDMAGTLEDNITTLLSLQAAEMSRTFNLKPNRHGRPPSIDPELEELLGDHEIVRFGIDYVTIMQPGIDGATAGNEIIDIRYRARRVLGDTRPLPETFDGIPCRSCDVMGLERAEPPSDPKAPAKKSRCASCGDTMDDATFEQWAAWYAGWTRRVTIPACRRCLAGRHDECAWNACSCDEDDHPRRRAAA